MNAINKTEGDEGDDLDCYCGMCIVVWNCCQCIRSIIFCKKGKYL
jgi:hypothetical protein